MPAGYNSSLKSFVCLLYIFYIIVLWISFLYVLLKFYMKDRYLKKLYKQDASCSFEWEVLAKMSYLCWVLSRLHSLLFLYYTFMFSMMISSVRLLSVLMILLSFLNVIRHYLLGNTCCCLDTQGCLLKLVNRASDPALAISTEPSPHGRNVISRSLSLFY